MRNAQYGMQNAKCGIHNCVAWWGYQLCPEIKKHLAVLKNPYNLVG